MTSWMEVMYNTKRVTTRILLCNCPRLGRLPLPTQLIPNTNDLDYYRVIFGASTRHMISPFDHSSALWKMNTPRLSEGNDWDIYERYNNSEPELILTSPTIHTAFCVKIHTVSSTPRFLNPANKPSLSADQPVLGRLSARGVYCPDPRARTRVVKASLLESIASNSTVACPVPQVPRFIPEQI